MKRTPTTRLCGSAVFCSAQYSSTVPNDGLVPNQLPVQLLQPHGPGRLLCPLYFPGFQGQQGIPFLDVLTGYSRRDWTLAHCGILSTLIFWSSGVTGPSKPWQGPVCWVLLGLWSPLWGNVPGSLHVSGIRFGVSWSTSWCLRAC